MSSENSRQDLEPGAARTPGPTDANQALSARKRLAAALANPGNPPAQPAHNTSPTERRVSLVTGLSRLDDDPNATEQAVGMIVRGLHDPASPVRREAAEQAGRRPESAQRLVSKLGTQLCDDPDRNCREAAAFALGESATPDAGVLLLPRLDPAVEPEPLVREAAAAALGSLAHEPALEALVEASRADKPTVRRRAVVALAAFADDKRAQDAITAALQDRDRYVREAADWLTRAD